VFLRIQNSPYTKMIEERLATERFLMRGEELAGSFRPQVDD
jgi:hypothetical protein